MWMISNFTLKVMIDLKGWWIVEFVWKKCYDDNECDYYGMLKEIV
jgi:hypothetical protein